MQLKNLIESILFWKNEPLSIKKLSLLSGEKTEDIEKAILELEEERKNTGIVLLRKNDEIALGTSIEASSMLEKLQKEELSKELSRPALETLSIVLYKGPLKRSEIDYIRGVNSQFIVRHLEARGLVERVVDPDDARSYLYKPTFDLLAHLGIKNITELPEHDVLIKEMENFTSIIKENSSEENREGNENHI